MSNATITKAVAIMYRALGQEVDDTLVKIVVAELEQFPEQAVLVALRRCMLEVKGRLALADVIERIPGQHPGFEQAWAMMSKGLNNEAVTLVQTHEMARAFGYALELASDPVAARMAFKEVYQAEVATARAGRLAPQWFVSPGSDATARDGPIMEAVRDGRLPLDYASQFLLPEQPGELAKLLTNDNPIKRLR